MWRVVLRMREEINGDVIRGKQPVVSDTLVISSGKFDVWVPAEESRHQIRKITDDWHYSLNSCWRWHFIFRTGFLWWPMSIIIWYKNTFALRLLQDFDLVYLWLETCLRMKTGIVSSIWILLFQSHPFDSQLVNTHIVFTWQALTGADGQQQRFQPQCNLLLCKSLLCCWWGRSSAVSRKIRGEARSPTGASQLIKPTTLIYAREQIHDRLLPAGHYRHSDV